MLKTRVRRTAPTYLISGIIVVTGVVGLVVGYKLVTSRKNKKLRRRR